MKRTIILLTGLIAMMLSACTNDIEMRYPPKYELPDLPVVEGIHDGQKAPLYWSIYEYAYEQEQAGVSGSDMDFTEAQWDEVIDWVATNLKPFSLNRSLMYCTISSLDRSPGSFKKVLTYSFLNQSIRFS